MFRDSRQPVVFSLTLSRLLSLVFALLFVLNRPARGQMLEQGQLGVESGITAASATLSTNSEFAATTSSGIHFLSGRIQMEPGSFVEWPDGSISTSANSPGILKATWTFFSSNVQISSPDFWETFSGSTITLNMSGRRALLSFNCPFFSVSSVMGVGFLVNGNFVDGQTILGNGLLLNNESAYTTNGFSWMGGFFHLTESTYSGDVSFSLAITKLFAGAGPVFQAALNLDEKAACQFSVSEH